MPEEETNDAAEQVPATNETAPEPAAGAEESATEPAAGAEELAPEPAAGAEESATEPAAGAEESTATAEAGEPELTIGSDAPEEAPEAVVADPTQIRGFVDRFGVAWGTGRRKTSVARVRIKEGSGQFAINGRTVEEYFATDQDQQAVVAPINATNMTGGVDVFVNVKGGGTTGQAGAIKLGVARALQAMRPELHGALSAGHYLTRDSRMVERKKYGRKKARKSFQFSKR